ncbi:MAG: winged helix-turn-helix domain-containing protein [Chloroflexi bacterium]|nr:winged helix-turn-helix domain-containing protein [Chloroflexota bacterium]
MLQDIARHTTEVVKAAGSRIVLLDELSDTLVTAAAYGEHSTETARRMPRQGCAAGWVIRHGQPLFVPRISDVTFEPLRSASERLGWESFIAVPLVIQGKAIGTLQVHSHNGRRLDASDVELLRGLAALAAIAIEHARRLRIDSEVPIIVVSARGEEYDKIDALNLGADDYLTKPFGVGELLARVRAVLRRTRREWVDTGPRLLSRGVFEMDPAARLLTVAGREVRLTRTEFDLLYQLMRQAGKVVPHNVLLSDIWGPEYRNQTEYLRVYIGRLRHKIEPDPASPRHLLTEPGLGYIFRP